MPKLISKGSHIYETDVPIGSGEDIRANAIVWIGGNDLTKFIPNITGSKWGDRCWLNVNAADFSAVVDEVLTLDGRLEMTIGSIKLRWYIDQNGRLEYEIAFADRPAKLSYRLDLDFPEGLVFFYQPEETDPNCHRREEVVGSYAAYWRQRHNEFKTGKFCHLFYPYLVDALGNRTRVETFDLSGKTLTISLPRKWMQNALYPVVLDPTLGYDTTSESTYAGTAYIGAASHDTATEDGDITQINLHGYNSSSGSYGYIACVYGDDAGNNRPQGQLAVEVTLPDLAGSSSGTVSAAYSASISNGVKYWLAANSERNQCEIWYDTGAANDGIYNDMGAYNLPDPWPDAGTNVSRLYEILVDYTATGGELHDLTADINSKTKVISIASRLFSFTGSQLSKTFIASGLARQFDLGLLTSSKTFLDLILGRVLNVACNESSKTLVSSNLGKVFLLNWNESSKTSIKSDLIGDLSLNSSVIDKVFISSELSRNLSLNSSVSSKTFIESFLSFLFGITGAGISKTAVDLSLERGFSLSSLISSKTLIQAALARRFNFDSSSLSKTNIDASIGFIIGLTLDILSKTLMDGDLIGSWNLSSQSVEKSRAAAILIVLAINLLDFEIMSETVIRELESGIVRRLITSETVDKILEDETIRMAIVSETICRHLENH